MRIVAFDLETGGLDPLAHQVIQIAALAVDPQNDWKELEAFEAKIKLQPGRYTQEALDINSYEPERWEQEALDELHALNKFAKFLRKYQDVEKLSKKGKPYRTARLMGHNARHFDAPFIKAQFDRQDPSLWFPADPYHVLDTLELARWKFHVKQTEKEFMSLQNLCKIHEIELSDAHDALADVRATVALARRLRG